MELPTKEQTMTIGYINIHGQTKLPQSKQNQIEYLVKEYEVDVLHLQETNIDESAFERCTFIANNYKVIFQNNDTGFGVCSLIHNKFSTSNELLHPSGRIIAFDIGNLTLANIYLPSGSESSAKNQREDLCGQTIPNMLLSAKKSGLIGGDWNCITHTTDCTHHPEPKMSPNLKKITSILKWKDTFRLLYPKTSTYSHFYCRQMTGTGLTQGASRLDRSYQWGELKTVSSEYIGAPFSDHMLHLVRVECPEATASVVNKFKPYFKVRPETAKDEEFQARVQQIVQDWQRFKEHIPLLIYWDLLKKDIRQAAKQISRERAKEKKATLTFLMLAQTHLSRKVSKGNLALLPKLKSIQLRINDWFDDQAEKVKLHARLQDIQQSEKIRIFHHEQLHRCINKSLITKLKTTDGIINGHKSCAEFLNKEVAELLGKEAELDEEAQEKLLDEVEETFTAKDNDMLAAEITDEEVKESLRKSNKKAAPGSDGLSFLVYEQCWSSLGRDLCNVIREVAKEGTPTESMKHSYLVFSPKPGKTTSLLPRDKRKLSMLQTDWKILTGILAARLRKTEDHTLSEHQYAAGPKRITHAICQARDAIQSVSSNQRGSGLAEMDFQAAYDKCVLSWTWKVLQKKKCSPTFLQILKRIYETSPSYVISIINNERQQRIMNRRKNIKQGDRTSTILYNYSVDPLLIYLHKRLQGIMYHKLHTAGPRHPKLGPAAPVEARLRVLGFVDDVKCALVSAQEFVMLDAAVRHFELASGSMLHRDPTTKKCQLLTLGKWSHWNQSQSPLGYLAIVEELNFLGVKLARSSAKSRVLNGEELTDRVKNTIASYKAGRHMPLVCRPHVVNTYVMSKITYRSAVLNLRMSDTQKIQSAVKQWLTQDLLLKPPEILLYRDVEQGGLGLVHAGSRCMANLIKTFVQQGHPESIYPNLFLNSLYRCYVQGELEPSVVRRPPYYPLELFKIIQEASEEEHDNILAITTRGWQKRILERGITHQRDEETGLPEVIQTAQEIKLKNANWGNIWMLRRRSGLTPAQKSWFFRWTEGLHVTNERLCKIGKLDLPNCDHCDHPDTRTHILQCGFNKQVGEGLQQVLEISTGGPVSEEDIGSCDLNLPSSLQLPVLFLLCEITKQLQASRDKKQPVRIDRMRAEIIAKAEAFLLSKKFKFAHSMVRLWLDSFFADKRVVPAGMHGAATPPGSSDNLAVVRGLAHPLGPEPNKQRGVGH